MSEAVAATNVWVTAANPAEPEVPYLVVGIRIDGDTGERVVAQLLRRGHEVDEGVFAVLPQDLYATWENDGPRLQVALLSPAAAVSSDGGEPRAFPRAPDGDVVLVERSATVDGPLPDPKTPVVVIDHHGTPSIGQLLAMVAAGETGISLLAP